MPSLPPDVGTTVFETASVAFVDAMNSGFWLSTAVLVSGSLVALWLLPNRLRADQVRRPGDELADELTAWIEDGAPAIAER